mgnify:CR=1 FL=1
MDRIEIDQKYISNDDPCYIIAEIGTGYRNFDEAKLLIDSAKEIGIDAIKIQTFKADTITSKNNFLDLEETGHVSQYELFKKLEISEEIQFKIVEYAKKIGITIFFRNKTYYYFNFYIFYIYVSLPIYFKEKIFDLG